MMERKLEKKMIEYIDQKLSGNGLAVESVLKKDARTLMRLAAQACVGVREDGYNSGPIVTLIQDTVGGPDHVAWCMSFVQTAIAYAELRTGKKSPVFASEHVLTTWNETPRVQRVIKIPLGGAIAIWRHGNSSSGHTGIVESCDGETFHAVEGNTGSGISPGGKIVREGDGVYFTHRAMDPVGEMRLLGFIKPF